MCSYPPETEQQRKTARCAYCGHEGAAGDEVRCLSVYLGGHGYVPRWECWHKPDCWRRQGWPEHLVELATYKEG